MEMQGQFRVAVTEHRLLGLKDGFLVCAREHRGEI